MYMTSLQCRILQRAMRMLKPGGRLVYSTCSLNPVENEAVVAASLQAMPDFSLVDVADRLPELSRRPGVAFWRVATDKEANTGFASYEDFIASLPESQRAQTKLMESHWPPPKDEVEALGLTKWFAYPSIMI
jgi:multisite-specific tRNA:(cytosine-C5)-methyltransferase